MGSRENLWDSGIEITEVGWGLRFTQLIKKRMIVYPLQLVSKCSVKQKNNNSHLKNISNIYVYKII